MGEQHKISRARFLTGAAAVGALAHARGASGAVSERPKAAALGSQSAGPRSAQFLSLGGSLGLLHTAHGGLVIGVVEAGPRPFPIKQISGYRVTDITLRYRFGNLPALEEEIQRFLEGRVARLDGEIFDTNPDDTRILSRLAFRDAEIVGVKLPALAATVKDRAHLTVRLKVESVERKRGAGDRLPVPSRREPQWLRSNFDFRLDGVDDDLAVTAVEAQIVRKVDDSYQVPNLTVTLPERRADELLRWHDSFVVGGNSGADNERSGSLTYLPPTLDRGQLIGRVDFERLGIISVAPAASREETRMVRAEMYCERALLERGRS